MKSLVCFLLLVAALLFMAACAQLPEDEAQTAKCQWRDGVYDPSACQQPAPVSTGDSDYKGKSGFAL